MGGALYGKAMLVDYKMLTTRFPKFLGILRPRLLCSNVFTHGRSHCFYIDGCGLGSCHPHGSREAVQLKEEVGRILATTSDSLLTMPAAAQLHGGPELVHPTRPVLLREGDAVSSDKESN